MHAFDRTILPSLPAMKSPCFAPYSELCGSQRASCHYARGRDPDAVSILSPLRVALLVPRRSLMTPQSHFPTALPTVSVCAPSPRASQHGSGLDLPRVDANGRIQWFAFGRSDPIGG